MVLVETGSGWQKPEFVVYPHAEGEVEYKIQSKNRIAKVNVESGKMMLSARQPNGAYFIHLSEMFGAKELDAPAELIEQLKALPRVGKVVKIVG